MRFVSLTLFLAVAAFAQAPPSGPDQQASPPAEPAAAPQPFQGKFFVSITPEQRARNTKRLEQALRAPVAVNITASPANVVTAGKPGQACSIPLLNAMPRNAKAIDRPMAVPPPPNSRGSVIRHVAPPAPPCPEKDAQEGAPAPDPKPKP